MTSFLDKLFGNFDEATARRELEMHRREAQAIQDTLGAYEQWKNREDNVLDPVAGGGTIVVETKATNGRRTRSSRAVIRKLIKEHGHSAEWTTPKVREALGLDTDADHGIQVSLSRMKRDGELERPQLGVYRLPRKVTPEGEDEGTGTPSRSPAKGAG